MGLAIVSKSVAYNFFECRYTIFVDFEHNLVGSRHWSNILKQGRSYMGGATMRENHLGVLLLACSFALCFMGSARAQCPALPNQFTNGQIADASQVMANFNSLAGCTDADNITTGNLAAARMTTNLSAALDSAFGSTQGSVLYRSASGWTALPPGTAGLVLGTNGAGANPSWVPPSGAAATDYFTAPGLSKSVPSSGFFTLNGSTNSTVTAVYSLDRVTLKTTTSSSGYQTGYFSQTYPGADFTITAQIRPHPHVWNNNTQRWGLAVRDTTGKIYIAGFADYANSQNADQTNEFTPSTLGSVNSNLTTVAYSWWQAWPWSGMPVWVRLQQSSGYFILSISGDGQNWKQLDDRATSVIGTPADIGLAYVNTASGQPDFLFDVFSWTVTTP